MCNFFRNTLSCVNKSDRFTIPTWIRNLHQPTIPFDESTPSYKEIATAVNKARLKASACPYDQLSIIIARRCPIIRTILTKLVGECWRRKEVPHCWRRGATVLIYKKGDTEDPSNYRPITIQPAWYKIFSVIYRQRLLAYLQANKYVDESIQKGFWQGSDGVTEHTELMNYIMKTRDGISVALS